jgi:hypothetical protein
VIGKVLRGTNVRRLLYYLYGPGKANEHTDPHLVAGFSDPAELEPERRPGGSRDFRRLAGLLEQPLAALPGPARGKPVWHCAVRAAPGDRTMSDDDWAQVAAQIIDRAGLAPHGDDMGVRWVAVRHAADHIHIAATLARQDGTRPRIWNDFFRVREACQQAERKLGLRSTAPADRTAAKRATRAETEQASRRGWQEPPRTTLRREVCTAAAGAGSEQEFFGRLQQAGVVVRRRHSVTNPGEITGYAVGLPHHTAKDGTPIWYGGGKLAADLTLPKLRARWREPAGQDSLSGAEMPATAVRAVLRNRVTVAAEQARDEAGFFARLRDDGVLVRLRFSEIDPGQVTGYAVTLPGHTDPAGALRWYGEGRLAAGLTLPQLRRRWGPGLESVPGRSGTFRFTAAERDAIYDHASRQAAAATEHIRHCAYHDPASAADAAWAVADTLHVAARAMRSRPLRCAADAYDRAARTAYGRIPRRTTYGNRLRTTARLLALAGDLADDTTSLAIALVANLTALAAAAAELRHAQLHAAQAAAARSAAEHMHVAVTQARSGIRRPAAGTRTMGQNRAGAGTGSAHRDFPVRLDPSVLLQAERGGAQASPHRGPLPPRHTGPRPTR